MVVDLLLNLFFSTLNILPIYLIAALGGFLSQRVGIYDISMEGNMTLGCALGMIGFFVSKSPWVGLLFGFGGGVVFGLILSTLSIRFNLDQIVIGFGLWFVGLGLASFLYKLYIPFDQSTVGFKSIAELLGLADRTEGLGLILDLDVVFLLSIACSLRCPGFSTARAPDRS